MGIALRSFVRRDDGSWMCIEATELHLPSGRIQVTAGTRFIRGRRFMGVDLAELLDLEQARFTGSRASS